MFKFSLQIVILGFVISLMGCSAQKLYEVAIGLERGSADLEKKSIKLGFGEITYLENNNKSDTAIVLLHGFGGDKDIWNRFSAELDPENYIVVLDLPGHGDSVATNDLDYSISHQAKMLNSFLIAKKINNIHIIGNSMGGAIALRFTNNYSDKVKTLILVDALGMIETKSEMGEIMDKTGINPFFDICTEVVFKKLLHFGMEKPPYIPCMFFDYIVAEKCARAKIEKIIYKDMIKDSDLRHLATNIKTPTLILWGEKDRVIHVKNADLFHKGIAGSELIIFESLGHVPLMDDPEVTATATQKFINKH